MFVSGCIVVFMWAGTDGWSFGFEQMEEALSTDGVLLALEFLQEGATVLGGIGPLHASPLSI